MADENLVLGKGNWATKAGKILGYRKASDRYYPVPFDVVRNTAVERINSLGQSELVAPNVAIIDFKEDFVAPADGSYYSFDGVNDYVALPNPTVSRAVNPFSLRLSIKTNSDVTTEQIIYCNVLNTTNRVSISIKDGKCSIYSSDGDVESVGVDVAANTKYDLFFTKPKENIGGKKIYISGIEQAYSSTTSVSPFGNTNELIGVSTVASKYFKGDDYLIETYNIELSSQEVLDRYNGLPIPDKYKGATNVSFWDDALTSVFGTVSKVGDEYTITGDGTNVNSFGQTNLWLANAYDDKYIILSYNIDSNTLVGGGTLDIGITTSDEFTLPISIPTTVGRHTLTIQPDRANTNNQLYFKISSANTSGSIVLSNISLIQAGNILNLSTGKTGVGTTEYASNFSAGVDGFTSFGLGDVLGNIDSIGGLNDNLEYKVNNVVGDTRAFLKTGVKTIGNFYRVSFDYYIPSTNTNLTSIYTDEAGTRHSVTNAWTSVSSDLVATTTDVKLIVGDSDTYMNPATIGDVAYIRNVKVAPAPTWYDLDHDIRASVIGAALQNSNGFGRNAHGILSSPVLKLQPAFSTYFLNSATPVTQTITTLTKGVTYTVNCKGAGIILISETGGNGRGGVATEVSHFTYDATETSVDITLVGGHDFEWVQMSNTASPMNHVPTLGSTISHLINKISLSDLDSVISTTNGVVTVVLNLTKIGTGITRRILSINDGTTTNRMSLYISGGDKFVFYVSDGGVSQAQITDPDKISLGEVEIQFTFEEDNFTLSKNGTEIGSDTSGTVPVFDNLDIGTELGTDALGDEIKSITF